MAEREVVEEIVLVLVLEDFEDVKDVVEDSLATGVPSW